MSLSTLANSQASAPKPQLKSFLLRSEEYISKLQPESELRDGAMRRCYELDRARLERVNAVLGSPLCDHAKLEHVATIQADSSLTVVEKLDKIENFLGLTSSLVEHLKKPREEVVTDAKTQVREHFIRSGSAKEHFNSGRTNATTEVRLLFAFLSDDEFLAFFIRMNVKQVDAFLYMVFKKIRDCGDTVTPDNITNCVKTAKTEWCQKKPGQPKPNQDHR